MIYLNGEWMPIEKSHGPGAGPRLHFRRRRVRGDPMYSGQPFRLREHLARLQSSLAGVRIQNPYSLERWDELVREMVVKNPMDDQYVYLQVTRGVAPRDHAFPKDVKPTVFMMSNPLIDAAAEPARPGRGRNHRHGQPLAALRHQVGVAARQLPAAPGRRRRGRGGSRCCCAMGCSPRAPRATFSPSRAVSSLPRPRPTSYCPASLTTSS